MDWRWQIGLLLLATLLADGCATCRDCVDCCREAPATLDCHVVTRGSLAPDLTAIPPRSNLLFNDDARTYCNLPEVKAQCLAATNAALARSLEQEAAALAAQPRGLHHKTDSTERNRAILHLQATHERNRAAASAMQLYLRLAEAEGGAANARLRALELNRLMTDIERLQAAGVQAAVSLTTTQSQNTELLHKQVELEVNIEQLNHQLVVLLGAEPPPDTRLWPDADLAVENDIPHTGEALEIALRQRTDLCAMRLAAGGDSLDMARAMLSQSGTGLGLTLGPCALIAALHPRAGKEEAAIRQQQMYEAIAEQERILAHDIAQAVATLEARVVQIGLSRHRVELLQQQHERMEKKKQIDPAAGFETRKAKLDLLAAEQDLLHDVIEWKLAVVRLKELQGELAIECGFLAALDCKCGPGCY